LHPRSTEPALRAPADAIAVRASSERRCSLPESSGGGVGSLRALQRLDLRRDLLTEDHERTRQRGDHRIVPGASGRFGHRRSTVRQLVAGLAENPPARVERDVAVQMPIEADDREDHLVLEALPDQASPREHDDPLGRDARADFLAEDPGDPVLERLGPAVERREMQVIDRRAGDDLGTVEVARYAHRTYAG